MKYIFILTIGVLMSVSCKKKYNDEVSFCADGYIYWGGSPAADGLGWYFAENRIGRWNAKQLKEEELPNQYKNLNDSTAVNICLVETKEKAPCFCPPGVNGGPFYFKIISIRKR